MKLKRILWILATLVVLAGGSIWFYSTVIVGDYRNRAQVAEAVSLLGSAKFPLAEYFADKQRWPKTLGEVVAETSGRYTQSVTITKANAGEIELTATMKSEGVDRRAAGQTVRLISPDGGKTWLCRPGTMHEKNLPASCRN